MTSNHPLVSVIIPTYESADSLETCLESIRTQSYPNVDAIVVDAHSSDGTVEIARKHDARVIAMDAERSAARNRGIREAEGEYVLCIDSDMELTASVIEECVETITSADITGVVIPERSVGDSFWVSVRDFERQFYGGTEVESARFFDREAALEVGGYDEDLVFFEESTLPEKLATEGYDVTGRVNAEIIHHEEGFSLLWWLRKKHYYGQTAAAYLARYENSGRQQTNPLHRYGVFFRQWRRFFSRPVLAFGVLALKTMEYASAGLGYIRARPGSK